MQCELMFYYGMGFAEVMSLDVGIASEFYSALKVIRAQEQQGNATISSLPHYKRQSDRDKFYRGLTRTINRFSERGDGNTISQEDFIQQFAKRERAGRGD